MKSQFESTYALLVRSENKSRTFLEAIAHSLLGLSAVIVLWQFAQQPVTVPAVGLQSPDGVSREPAIEAIGEQS